MGWPLNVQRSFACGFLQCPFSSLVSSYKGVFMFTTTTYREGLQISAVDDMGVTKDLLQSVAVILNNERQVSSDSEQWRMWKKGEHAIADKLIPDYTWKVLRRLQANGHGTYLVGGSVRDLLLNKSPKDFDVITTAPLYQVKKRFPRAFIVGKRFPICTVHIENKVVEVSSFNTKPHDQAKPNMQGSHNVLGSAVTWCATALDQTHYARWENSMKRDFTINGLFYDPFEKTLFDYLGGVEDLIKRKVRTVSPANESFREDSARVLRAVRIAGRLGFKFARDTAKAIKSYASSINSLPLDRLRREAKFLMSYGASEESFRLLWRFGMLETLLPHQAAYLAAQGFKRQDKGSNMLLMLLENLDKVLSPAKPCHCCLWINILALHLALYQHPESRVVICTLALAIRGLDVELAASKAIRLHKKYGNGVEDLPELDRETSKISKSKIKRRAAMLCANILQALELMCSEDYVAMAMQLYPGAPSSRVVIVSKTERETCTALFRRVNFSAATLEKVDSEECSSRLGAQKNPKKTINREALENGCVDETSFVLSHIVLSTLYLNAAAPTQNSK